MHIDTRDFTTRLSEWIKGKTVTMPNDVVGVKELERSFVAGGHVTMHSHSGKHAAVSYKTSRTTQHLSSRALIPEK